MINEKQTYINHLVLTNLIQSLPWVLACLALLLSMSLSYHPQNGLLLLLQAAKKLDEEGK